MSEPGLIYKRITEVMNDVGAVAKDQKNQQQGFMYRGVDAVMNAISPAFQKHGVFVVPTIIENTRESRITAKGNAMNYSICKIEYRFFAEDGSYVTATVIGEAMDSADKATNKAMAVAFKYACFQVLCIPTEEMRDPDEESIPSAPAESKEKKSNVKAGKKSEPKDPPAPSQGVTDSDPVIGPAHVSALKKEIERTGLAESVILNLYKVKRLEDLTTTQFAKAMRRFEATKSKEDKHE